MKLSEFDNGMPNELIALHPAKNRDESKLMILHSKSGDIEHRTFKDIIHYFDDQDSFIFNDTKVFPAKLNGNKEKTGAQIEVFLLRELNRHAKSALAISYISDSTREWWPKSSTTPLQGEEL